MTTAPDEDFTRRERLLLQTSSSSSSSSSSQSPAVAPAQQSTPTPQFPPGERFGSTSERFPTSAERFPNVSSNAERFSQTVATPPERFSSQSSTPTERYCSGSSTPERYHTPTPGQERYASSSSSSERFNAANSNSDRYNPPPAPTPERYTPENRLERYGTGSDRFSERYANGERYTNGDRYIPPPAPSGGERYINTIPGQNGVVERFSKSPVPSERYIQDRFSNNYLQTPSDRYPPPPAPNERYVPSQGSDRYTTNFLPPSPNYLPNGFITPAAPVNPGDPYMRRDLGYHHHYRLSHPNYHPHHHYHHYHRALPTPHHRYHQHILPSPNHRNHQLRCCPSPSHIGTNQLSCSVNSTSSQTTGANSAPVTVAGTPNSGSREYLSQSPSMPRGRTSQRNSIVDFTVRNGTPGVVDFSATIQRDFGSNQRNCVEFGARLNGGTSVVATPVEYVGASGGRHVSTPPPPPPAMLPRCASMSNCDVGGESGTCEHKTHRHVDKLDGSTMSLCCASTRRYGGQMDKVGGRDDASQHGILQHHHTSVWRAVGQAQGTPHQSPQATPPGSTPVVGTSPTATPSSPPADSSAASTATPSTASPSASSQHGLERSTSAPEPTPVPSVATSRPPLQRSMSRSEVVKKYIRRETAVFFGLEPDCEKKEQAMWLERRKRLACRKYGQLREEFQPSCAAQQAAASAAQRSGQLHSAYQAMQQGRDSRPDVLPVGRDSTDLGRDPTTASPRWSEPPVRRKESVARMTFGGLAYVVTTLTRHRPAPIPPSRQYTRSFQLDAIPETSALVGQYNGDMQLEEQGFFEREDPDASTVNIAAPAAFAAPALLRVGVGAGVATPPLEPASDEATEVGVGEDAVDAHTGGFSTSRVQVDEPVVAQESYSRHRLERRSEQKWRRVPPRAPPAEPAAPEPGPEVGCSRIWSRVLDRAFDNSDRRQYGMGFVGRFFGRTMKRSVRNQETVKGQLEDIEDYRPFFTYWITTVQVLILFISLFCYGLGPVGFDLANRSGEVLVTSLSLQQVEYQEPANFWIGPRAGDLIHLGAKFAPCMRRDAKIIKEIEKGREKERETACCIRNDDSGCVQSSQADCSVRGLGGPTTISTWKKWSSGDSGPGGRISGSVCGLDPKHCESPASVAPYEWPDDITKWPICRKTKSQSFRPRDKVAEHMVCEVIGHPCCIGIHGQCRITTKEYCDFVRGYFHEEASLCSQVSCLDDVCGMIPFYSPEVPDQFYRLWTSLFLHAGVGHLVITLAIQWFLMRDLEKLTGPLRIGIIYMGSGIAGNLASAIFVPYRAEVGPAGAQFGLLACLIVEVLNVWPMLKRPEHALLKLISVTLVLFLFGLLPWVDNYAHLFGFVFGFLLSYALMPFVSFGPYDRHKKRALIWVCLISALLLFCALVVLFYVIPVYDCDACAYFTCLPLTRDFCASQNINFRREEPVV